MICPRCRRGLVCHATVPQVYVCDACDALWTHSQAIGPATHIDLAVFLQTHAVATGRAALTNVDRDWDGSKTLNEVRAAVEMAPADVAAWVRLALLLLEADAPAAALEHLTDALSREPAHLEALRAAAQAATLAGDATRADGYRRLLRALCGPASPVEAVPSMPPVDTTAEQERNQTDQAPPARQVREV